MESWGCRRPGRCGRKAGAQRAAAAAQAQHASLNPNAKSFSFNINAKEFRPSASAATTPAGALVLPDKQGHCLGP